MLLMIIALMLVFATVTALYLVTKEKSIRNSLLISVGLHVVFFIKFFSAAESFSIPVHYDAIDFTFIPNTTETASQSLPELSQTSSVPDGVKLYSGKIPQDRPKPVEKKKTKQTLKESIAKKTDKTMPPLEKIKWFDFNKHPQGASYRKRLHRIVAEHQVVPKEIMEKGWDAKITVWFNLSRDGTLNKIFVDKHFRSNYDLINQASIDSVRTAARYFPALPKGVKNSDIWFEVTLDYTRFRK